MDKLILAEGKELITESGQKFYCVDLQTALSNFQRIISKVILGTLALKDSACIVYNDGDIVVIDHDGEFEIKYNPSGIRTILVTEENISWCYGAFDIYLPHDETKLYSPDLDAPFIHWRLDIRPLEYDFASYDDES